MVATVRLPTHTLRSGLISGVLLSLLQQEVQRLILRVEVNKSPGFFITVDLGLRPAKLDRKPSVQNAAICNAKPFVFRSPMGPSR